MQDPQLINVVCFYQILILDPSTRSSNGKEPFQSQDKRWVLKLANTPNSANWGLEMWATKRLQLILEDTIPLLGGSPNMQNFYMDHNQITPFILRAEGLADCLHRGSTAYVLDNLLLLGNWWICRAFHAHANSLSHQTSPAHLHTHCISTKISHNSAPQRTWSSNISMPDLPFSSFPWAAQLQLHFGPSTGTMKLFGRSPRKVAATQVL